MEAQIPASDYDQMIDFASHPTETEATVTGLARLAGGRHARVLELGIGTGRLALPLAPLVGEMHGVELDQGMADALRAKPGGEQVHLHIADMSRPLDAGTFDLVFIAFGTLFALPTQNDQVNCFQAAADQLRDRGRFVVEALVPQPATYNDGHKVTVASIDADRVLLNVSLLDTAAQVLTTQQVSLSDGDVRLFPNRIRYAWPAELDLMARLAGLRLRERWSDWNGTAFDQRSPRHISIYAEA